MNLFDGELMSKKFQIQIQVWKMSGLAFNWNSNKMIAEIWEIHILLRSWFFHH